MPRYRIHRIKEAPREHFRWAAHTGGLAIVKPRDYESGVEVESASPYSLWRELQNAGVPGQRPLAPGDVLESLEDESLKNPGSGPLLIVKYIGFEPAQWFVPEVKAQSLSDSATEESSASHPAAVLQGS